MTLLIPRSEFWVHTAELVEVLDPIFKFMKELETDAAVVSKVYAMAAAVSFVALL